MRVTLKDISKMVNVDVGSVSYALRNHPKAAELRPETRERILTTARELGYRRNELAATVRTGVNRTVAVVGKFGESKTIELNNAVFGGILAAASKLSFGVRIFPDNDLRSSFDEILGSQIRYVLATSAEKREREELASLCRENQIHLVFLFEKSHEDFPAVGPDNVTAGLEATTFLARSGHRRIAFVGAPLQYAYARERHLGYLLGLRRLELKRDQRLVSLAENPESDVMTMLALPSDQRPTAFFCLWDGYAARAQVMALKMGLRVPEDVSVIGFGDTDVAKNAYAPLTSIAEPYEKMGWTATRLLLERIDDVKPVSPGRYLLPAPLVHRESVFKLNNNARRDNS